MTLHLVRDGEVTSVDIQLTEGWKSDPARSAEYFDGYLGMTLQMWREASNERPQFATPVITRVQSLGPAHKAHIASSQRAIGYRGPFAFPVLLDVKTVTGAVIGGVYHAIAEVEDLERIAEEAFVSAKPVLLEIQYWGRSQPNDLELGLSHLATSFYKVTPAITTAATAAGPQAEGQATDVNHRQPPFMPNREANSANAPLADDRA